MPVHDDDGVGTGLPVLSSTTCPEIGPLPSAQEDRLVADKATITSAFLAIDVMPASASVTSKRLE